MNRAKLITHWTLLAISILFLFSGFGITEFRTVEAITGGLFTKVLAFRMHEVLWIPFVVFLVLHVTFSVILRRRKMKAAGRAATATN